VDILCQSIEEGLNERKFEKDKDPGMKDKKGLRKDLETKDIPAALIEAIVEEEEEAEAEEEEKVTGDVEEEEEEAAGEEDETEEEEEK
jgi:hypothetical protein